MSQQPLFAPMESHLVVLVDTSNFAYRCAFAGADLRTSDGRASGHMHRAVKSVATLRRRFPQGELIFAIDVPRKETFRKQLYPEYKEGRRSADELDYSPVKDIHSLIAGMHCKVAMAEAHEADDVIAAIVTKQTKSSYVIVSTDKDLWSLLRFPSVTILNPREPVERKHFVKAFGDIDPRKVPLHKAILGDTSDNIPKVPRIRSKKVAELLQQCETLDDVFEKAESFLSPKETEKVLGMQEMIRLNLQLANLQTDLEYEVLEYEGNRPYLERLFDLYELDQSRSDLPLLA
jgi:5'-3' exonuclease